MAVAWGSANGTDSGSLDPETISVTLGTINNGDTITLVFVGNAAVTTDPVTVTYDGSALDASWTQVGGSNFGATTTETSVWVKKGATSADTGKVFTVSWAAPTTVRSLLWWFTVSGADATTPLAASARAAENGTGNLAHVTPTVTTSVDTLIVHILAIKQSSLVSPGWTTASPYTQQALRIQGASGTNALGIYSSNSLVTAGSGIGGVTYTSGVSTPSGTYWTLAFQSATSTSLAPANASMSMTSAQLTVDFNVTPDNAAQAQVSTSPSLGQNHVLVLNDAGQSQVSDSVGLVQEHSLAVDNSAQAHSAEQPTLSSIAILTIDSAAQAQVSETPTLAQQHSIAVSDVMQAHTATQLSLAEQSDLTPANAVQAHAATSPTLVQNFALSVQSATHAHAAVAPKLTIEWRLWSVNLSPTSAQVTARTTGGDTFRLAVSTSSAMTSPTFHDSTTPDAQGRVRLTATGLTPNTEYFYQLANTPSGGTEGLIGRVGEFQTFPEEGTPATFSVAVTACWTTNAADSTATDDLAAWKPNGRRPLFNVDLGDKSYFSPTSTSAEVHATGIESQILGAAGMRALMQVLPEAYVRSDHDSVNVDNADSNTAVNQASIDAYKLYAPHHPLADQTLPTDSLNQSWVVGRVRFIMTDIRNMNRSPGLNTDNSSKTMLGAAQLAWLLDELEQPEPLKVLLTDVGWMGPASLANAEDKWWAYANERQIIIDHIAAVGARVELMHGDSHLIGVTSRESNAYGNFPVSCFAPMHNVGGGRNPNEFDVFFSNNVGNCRQYGRVTFTDNITDITVRKEGWDAVGQSNQGVLETTVWDLSDEMLIADAAQAQVAGSPSLAQQQNLVVANAAQTQTSASPTLQVIYDTAPDNAAQAQSADTLALTQLHQLTTHDAAQAQAASTVSVTKESDLQVDVVFHALTSDLLALTEQSDLLTDSALHGHQADQVQLVEEGDLFVHNAAQGLASDLLTLLQGHVLTVEDVLQGHEAESLELVNSTNFRDLSLTVSLEAQNRFSLEIEQNS
jgi:phosphodiesterase/alkaline phosphatase D-like protein